MFAKRIENWIRISNFEAAYAGDPMNGRIPSKILSDDSLDRLVDGELAPVEYNSLLAALDDDPTHWRRCAMAFLEAQAWRREMSAIRRGQEMTSASAPAVTSATRSWRRWLPLLAIAASFVAAFLFGLAVQRQLDRRQRDGDAIVQTVDPRRSEVDRDVPPGEEGFVASGQEPRSLGNIRLVVDSQQGTQPQQIDLPVYDLNEVGAQWLTQDRPALSAEVIESLKRRGRRVERHIEFLPLPLDDEHQVVVPVEQIQITPVSRRSY